MLGHRGADQRHVGDLTGAHHPGVRGRGQTRPAPGAVPGRAVLNDTRSGVAVQGNADPEAPGCPPRRRVGFGRGLAAGSDPPGTAPSLDGGTEELPLLRDTRRCNRATSCCNSSIRRTCPAAACCACSSRCSNRSNRCAWA
jgi:hypothetical protein